MWRKRLLSVGISTCGFALVAAGALGMTSMGAGADTPPLRAPPAHRHSALPGSSLPVSASVPITALENQIAGTALPGQDSTTGTNTTTQSSSVADVAAPVNACSLSVGADAGAGSGCSTTSVGSSGDSNVANVNVPVTVQDNAAGLLNQEGSALGLTSGQSSAATTQDGMVNADAPVSICSVDAGVAGDTSSECGLSGTEGATSQTGVVDADAPVTVCDIIAEVDGSGSASCPQETSTGSQSGQAGRRRRPGDGVWRSGRGRRLGRPARASRPATPRSRATCRPATRARAPRWTGSSRSAAAASSWPWWGVPPTRVSRTTSRRPRMDRRPSTAR